MSGFDIRSGEEIVRLQQVKSPSSISSIRLLNDSNYLLSADFSGSVRLWDVRKQEIVTEYQSATQDTLKSFHVDVDESENLVFANSNDLRIRCWSLRNSNQLYESEPLSSHIRSFAMVRPFDFWVCQVDKLLKYGPICK